MNQTSRRAGDGPDAGVAARRFANRSLEAQFGVPGPFNQSRPVTDPQNQTSSSLHSFDVTARIIYGIITDCTAIGNVYRVQLEKAKQTVVAIYGSRTSNAIFGAREVTTLQPGSLVTCVWHEQMPYAQILTVLPPAGTAANLSQHAIIHGASRARVDEAHKRPFRMDSNGNIPASLAGRPFDAITCGETGWITETGLKAFVDSFMALFGVDEGCQISFHYHDMLCRLSAYQLQLWTSVRETESLNDQDESQDWTGYAMYPWENLGLAARADPTIINSAPSWQLKLPHYGKMEPIDDYLMPWHREREFHGYLGQGGKHCVIAPPVEFTDNGDKGSINAIDMSQGARTQHTSYIGGSGAIDAHHPGLFDRFITADGRYCLQSAKGISLVKRATIMLPTRRRRPEEPQGDDPQNYKFSGVLGGGAEHKVTGDIETTGTHSGFSRAMGILDMHSYFFNYVGVHPFFYHAADYKLYEESQATWTDGVSAETPDFTKLASEQYIDPEDYQKTWQIDHRYGEQKFYTLSSGFDLQDDGSIMIGDGYGASMRMVGGGIELSAPGDIWIKPGRNANIWAGHDVAIRAKHSWDITATEADGRLKAEKNLMLLSGNNGEGGTLIESRGFGQSYNFDTPGEQSQFGGVVIRSPKAPFVVWSNAVYVRTGGPGISAGPIVLDANRGKGSVSVYAEIYHNYLNNGMFWHFNTNEETVAGPSAMISSTSTLLPGDMCLKGSLVADGSGIFNGSVATTHSFAAVNAPLVGKLEGDSLHSVQEALSQCREFIEQKIPADVGQKYMDALLKPRIYNAQKPGNDDVILKTEFSLRTQEDYKTEDFKLYEDRWQQLGRLTGKANAKWHERSVLFQGQDTYPYPGKESFQSSSAFIQQNLTIFDAPAGRSKDRGSQPDLSSAYSDPKFGDSRPTGLNEYIVIR